MSSFMPDAVAFNAMERGLITFSSKNIPYSSQLHCPYGLRELCPNWYRGNGSPMMEIVIQMNNVRLAAVHSLANQYHDYFDGDSKTKVYNEYVESRKIYPPTTPNTLEELYYLVGRIAYQLEVESIPRPNKKVRNGNLFIRTIHDTIAHKIASNRSRYEDLPQELTNLI